MKKTVILTIILVIAILAILVGIFYWQLRDNDGDTVIPTVIPTPVLPAAPKSSAILQSIDSFPLSGSIALTISHIDTPSTGPGGGYLSHDDIYLLDEDGSRLEKIIDYEPGNSIERISWSPQGRWLGFIREDVQRLEYIDFARSAGKNISTITPKKGRDIFGYEWSPDENKLALIERGEKGSLYLNIFDLQSGRRENEFAIIPPNEDRELYGFSNRFSNSYSAWIDNEHIVTIGKDKDGAFLLFQFTLSKGLKSKREIVPMGEDSFNPFIVSPDKESIAYFKQMESSEVGEGELWLSNVDGSGAKKIIDPKDNSPVIAYEVYDIKFSPDNRLLAYSHGAGDGVGFYILNRETGNIVWAEEPITFFEWLLDSKSLIAHSSFISGASKMSIVGINGKLQKILQQRDENALEFLGDFARFPVQQQ